MVALLHPGVYVQEVPSGARSIEGVATSTAIFVGETERGPLVPTKIRGPAEYARLFGGYLRPEGSSVRRVAMRYATDLFFQNGGTSAYVLRASWNGVTTGTAAGNTSRAGRSPQLEAASPGEWGNGVFAIFQANGARFRVVVYYAPPGGAPSFVEDWDRLSADRTDVNYAGSVLARSAFVRWVEGSEATPTPAPASDTLPTGANIVELTASQLGAITAAQFSSGTANDDTQVTDAVLASLILPRLDGIDDAAIIVGATERWVNTGSAGFAGNDAVRSYFQTLRAYVDVRPKQDLFYVADVPRFQTNNVTEVRDFVLGSGASTFAAVYWPHLIVADPVGPTASSTIALPPAGAVAGIYARTDAARGVSKAPAGTETVVNGVQRADRDVIDGEQDDLNPAGINAIRPIPGAGTVVWGSRTLRPASEWRYIPVRRLAMFLRKSIFNGIQFAVFEPNDRELWASLRATIGAFMETQFRNGAFAGSSSREAYFVKVDAETTTDADQAAGLVNILVGFAPLRPAEFVVVTLSQKTASAT